jgi:hypothetical protein
VVALLVGVLMTVLKNAKTMPPKDVLERATARARQLEAQEKAEQTKSGD